MMTTTELQIPCRSCGGPTLDPGNGQAWCRHLHCPEGWGAVDHADYNEDTTTKGDTIMAAPTFYTDEGTRYCHAPGCERSATHHTPPTGWACVFHAPGTWRERLEIMPALSQGQTSDLKAEVSGHRIWLSRMTIEDGMPYAHTVEVEVFQPIDGRWTPLGEFDGDSETAEGLFGTVNMP